jgi:hypothetical protein
MPRYTIYPGSFVCHECKEDVKTLRLYKETKELTWMCSQKHLTSVILYKKKSKKDYE